MKRTQAFTLVELAIVIVILGLLVGGIIGGKALIYASQLRSITSQAQRYMTAAGAFHDQYRYLPGDIPLATNVWGTATNCPGDENHPSAGQPTCNGNGDEQIASDSSQENFKFWQHLSNAGMIEGQFNGVSGSYVATGNARYAVAGANSPAARPSNSGFYAEYLGYQTLGTFFPGDYGNAMIFGGTNTSASQGQILAPADAASIDAKMDDGLPGKGDVRPEVLNTLNCSTTTDQNTAAYSVNTNNATCNLVFLKAF